MASLSAGSRKLPIAYCVVLPIVTWRLFCFWICWPAQAWWPLGTSSLAPLDANKQAPTCLTLKFHDISEQKRVFSIWSVDVVHSYTSESHVEQGVTKEDTWTALHLTHFSSNPKSKHLLGLDVFSQEMSPIGLFCSCLYLISIWTQPEASFPVKAEGDGAPEQPTPPQEGWTHHYCQEAISRCGWWEHFLKQWSSGVKTKGHT